jgi:hypothetical protein
MRIRLRRAGILLLASLVVVGGALWAGGVFESRPPCAAPEARPFPSVARLELMFDGAILDMPGPWQCESRHCLPPRLGKTTRVTIMGLIGRSRHFAVGACSF